MNSMDIIKEIRLVVKTGKTNFNINPFLKKHHCEFLCINDDSYNTGYLNNKSTVMERLYSCKNLFDKLDIPYAVFKGMVLSKQLYGDPFIRKSGDIDILFSMTDYKKLKAVLDEEGFIQGTVQGEIVVEASRRKQIFQISSSHQIPSYVKKLHNKEDWVTLDFNHNLMWGENPKKIDMSFVLEYTQIDEILGVSFRKLTAEMEFVALCLHHYKDLNSLLQLIKGHFRLNLFWDIYKYLITVKPDSTKIHIICDQLEVGEYVFYCIYYTQRIFDSKELDDYLDVLRVFKREDIIDTYGLSDDERRKWDIPFEDRLICETLPIYVYEQLTDIEKNKINANIKYI